MSCVILSILSVAKTSSTYLGRLIDPPAFMRGTACIIFHPLICTMDFYRCLLPRPTLFNLTAGAQSLCMCQHGSSPIFAHSAAFLYVSVQVFAPLHHCVCSTCNKTLAAPPFLSLQIHPPSPPPSAGPILLDWLCTLAVFLHPILLFKTGKPSFVLIVHVSLFVHHTCLCALNTHLFVYSVAIVRLLQCVSVAVRPDFSFGQPVPISDCYCYY